MGGFRRSSNTQKDWHLAYYRVTRAEYPGEVVPFAEIVMAKMTNNSKMNPSKLAPRWVPAAWLGRSSVSDEHMVGCDTNVWSTRTVRRLANPNQWDERMLKTCIGVPWCPQRYTREQIMENFDQEMREKKAAAATAAVVILPPRAES